VARRFVKIRGSRIVYDPDLVNQVDEAMFDQKAWPDAPAAPGYSGGRGKTLYIGSGDDEWVLRHYHRGGMAGRWLDDTFFWFGDSRTRPFAEWILLDRLVTMNLPVPRPVAGRFLQHGPFYTADLITKLIPDVEPLSTRWAAGPLAPSLWRRIGELIGRFHARRVFHADLTAHNIQINSSDELFLLDFDRGRIMPRVGGWAEKNLSRFHRSLQKISKNDECELSESDWDMVMTGYRSVVRN
jgi:3-deoxy-D-manno-octulosonic acid kinase